MSRMSRTLLLLAALLSSPLAATAGDDVEQGLATLWEVLWHQSGTPTRVVRWENEIRVRFSGLGVAAHREHSLGALRAVTQEAGVKLVDVTDHAPQTANLSVEFTSDSALDDNQPCATSLDFRTETRIDSATVQMRGRDAWRCAYHEAMHVMGVRGHPAGKTVLSYFPWKVDALMPLDKVMLRAWYSPAMRGGMTPFEALPVLADELVATQPDKALASQARDRFFATTVEQMQAYANGTGDVPVIVKRSGKSTEEGIRYGRTEMSYFLGVAYQEGVTVRADPNQAIRWYELAASAGNRRAQARLGSFR
ncbi:SEL1-like repeat protein [Ramlibacter tataouinensis]|uniref:Uncharacterized protein n=1 Tax=Ramlibacter tataouinensis (strain ATCC BAA-407 / DSM 14655 / LMG 21543 / TTB310) TaxID=365046 RepID=F5Y0A4_RAMTT|nr:SEL1-like repeat protein [Ramlibacter tataouinensis]AEG92126.1 hypothetical protein Rta_10410 [Ramlibacter tataouinensis TTB310]